MKPLWILHCSCIEIVINYAQLLLYNLHIGWNIKIVMDMIQRQLLSKFSSINYFAEFCIQTRVVITDHLPFLIGVG